MSVSDVTASYNLSAANFATLRHRRGEDFKAMEAAVQSGDLGTAQKALSAWQQDSQNINNAQVSSAHSNPLESDRDALVSAVQSGDLSGAQKALGTLEQDRQSLRSASAGQSPTTFSGDLLSLLQTGASGDVASARKDAVSSQNDMKATEVHHHHHHGGFGANTATSNDDANALTNPFSVTNGSNAIAAYATTIKSSMISSVVTMAHA